MRIRRVERNAENRMANWVSAGCGVIANELAQAMEKRGQKLYGVVNRTPEKAVAFAEKYGVQKVFTSFQDVCADPAVDIIYISTPHNTHIHFLRKALAAGKHVLCEKSITLNSEELEEAVQLAKEHGVVLAEAMTIYHMPIYKELKKRMDAGKFGELRVIQMNFGSYKEYDMKNRFFQPESGRRSTAGHRCVCPFLCQNVLKFLPGSDYFAGEACTYRCGRAGGNTSDEPGAGDGNGHIVPACQAAQTGHDLF